jgi:antitoxin component of MazEF toxin-antitoxin module
MSITSIQKVIKVGSSAGVTIPAKDMQQGGIEVGDNVKIVVTKQPAAKTGSATDKEVIDAARQILKDYHQAFENLAQR